MNGQKTITTYKHNSMTSKNYLDNILPGPSISAKIVVKSSSLTLTLIPSGGESSRFFNSLANCLITFGGRFSLVAFSDVHTHAIRIMKEPLFCRDAHTKKVILKCQCSDANHGSDSGRHFKVGSPATSL